MEIKPGLSHSVSVTVGSANTAKAVGSGDLPVFATPMMIALMEEAAAGCLAPLLEEVQSSVGTEIAVSHTSATPVGMRVTATATITAADRRRVEFEVTARDDAGEIGGGSHSRVIIDRERFMAKAEEKITK